MDISQISQEFERGVARKNRFRILIPSLRRHAFYAKAVNLPSVSIGAPPVRHYAPAKKAAVDVIYEDLNLEFYIDRQYNVRSIFQDWHDRIYNVGTGTFAFRDDYTEDIIIDIEDETGTIVSKGTIIEAYPMVIGDVAFSMDSENEINTFPVTFTYNYYRL